VRSWDGSYCTCLDSSSRVRIEALTDLQWCYFWQFYEQNLSRTAKTGTDRGELIPIPHFTSYPPLSTPLIDWCGGRRRPFVTKRDIRESWPCSIYQGRRSPARPLTFLPPFKSSTSFTIDYLPISKTASVTATPSTAASYIHHLPLPRSYNSIFAPPHLPPQCPPKTKPPQNPPPKPTLTPTFPSPNPSPPHTPTPNPPAKSPSSERSVPRCQA
jgi:hypothetical protein